MLDWKKIKTYQAKATPEIIDIPEMQYLIVSGKGDPNQPSFQTSIQALYGLAYPIKIKHKKQHPERDFVVFPMEGVWDLDEEGRKLTHLDKSHLVYDLMIAQPECIEETFVDMIKEEIRKKKKTAMHDHVRLIRIREGLSCQMLHIGSYDSEPESFEKMESYVKSMGYERVSKIHREIYLSDARKTSPDALRTILRFGIRKKEDT